MVHVVRRGWFAAAFAGLVLAAACNDPEVPRINAVLGVLDTTLTVGVNSTGSYIDPDGYTVWVDFSRSQAIGPNGFVTFSGLAAGEHAVALYGIASNCGVNTVNQGANNPRGVVLTAGEAAATQFWVGCGAWGGLFVSANTTGVDLDADGYTVMVDSGASRAIATNGSVMYTGFGEGPHSVALSGMAGNCTLSGDNPRTITVSPGGTASTTFSASCAPTGSGSGSLTVMTSSTGSNLDPDGYTVTVDGSLSQAIATTDDSVTFTIPAGDHPVALAGIASNCTLSGANPLTVTVLADGAATTTFSVTCGAPVARVIGKGQLALGSPTPRDNAQTFDFDVRADLTGRFTYTDWSDIHPSGTPGTVITDQAADPETSITAYRNSSSACSDPSRGAEFEAVGRDDQGFLISYKVQLCDGGPAGSGMDFFSFFDPAGGSFAYGRSGTVTSGDLAKR